MAKIVIDEDVHGPTVHIAVNGTDYTLSTGETLTVTAPQLEALDNGNITYERVWRFANTTFATLTIDNDTIQDDAVAEDPVGTISGALSGSTLTLTVDGGGLFALDGTSLVVADTLVADTYDLTIRESNDEIEELTNDTVIQITVEVAA